MRMSCSRVVAAVRMSRYSMLASGLRRMCLCQTSVHSVIPARNKTTKVYNTAIKFTRKKLPTINVYKEMSVKELATAMNKSIDHIFDCLSYINTSTRVRHQSVLLDLNIITEVCNKSGVRPRIIARPSLHKAIEVDNDVYSRQEPDPTICKPRPPVVTIMGHVDHGKTTLLDYLRKSNIVDQEFGGITQHIGAFSIKLKNDKSITFLDTPGHAAFSAMRGRGAQLTDIIVLVVAADDGVMPQTIESIKHAMQTRSPMIVAINKCDRAEAEVQACKEDLAEHGVVLEELGGDVMGVEISALHGTNIDALQESIITQAELMDIKADFTGSVEGRVIESKTEEGRGKVASVLIQRGMLTAGSFLVASTAHGKVKGLFDEHGKRLKSAGPGTAVEVISWKELPAPGDQVLQVDNESEMKKVINYRKAHGKQLKMDEEWNVINEKRQQHSEQHIMKVKRRHEDGLSVYTKRLRLEFGEWAPTKQVEEVRSPQLPLIVKADVDGSLEAILSCLETYNSDLCDMDIILSDVGEVTVNDVEMSDAFNGVILAFNTRIPERVEKLATTSNVAIRKHNIIYKLIDDVKELINERVPLVIEHRNLGEAVIQKVFTVSEKIDKKNKQITVAGCLCVNGVLKRNQPYKLIRGTDVIHSGTLYMLKHFKTEVEEIKDSMECGLALKDHSVVVQEGDTLICYEEYEVQPEITWNLPF